MVRLWVLYHAGQERLKISRRLSDGDERPNPREMSHSKVAPNVKRPARLFISRSEFECGGHGTSGAQLHVPQHIGHRDALESARKRSMLKYCSSFSSVCEAYSTGDGLVASTTAAELEATEHKLALTARSSISRARRRESGWFVKHQYFVATKNLVKVFVVATSVECAVVLLQYFFVNSADELLENTQRCRSVMVSKWILSALEGL